MPKTCVTIGVELNGKACGTVSDGCGVNYIDCGACDSQAQVCGGAAPNPDGSPGVGVANLCGGGCTKYTGGQFPWLGLCPDPQKPGYDAYDTLYICNAKDLTKPPSGSGCFYRAEIDTKKQHAWCCVN